MEGATATIGRRAVGFRLGIALLFLLAVANGLFLYLSPSSAAADYAWPVKPPISAAAMGAGYLAGVLATGLALYAPRWRSLRSLALGLGVLGVVLLAATLIHSDRFRWDYAPTWLWTAVYALAPIALAAIWLRQRGLGVEEPPRDPALGAVRAAALVMAAVFTACGAVMFAAPEFLLDGWPWQLSELMSRILAGWYLLAGAVMWALARVVRANDAPLGFVTAACWTTLTLLAAVLHSDDIQDGSGLWLWVALHVIALAVWCWSIAVAVAQMRVTGERL